MQHQALATQHALQKGLQRRRRLTELREYQKFFLTLGDDLRDLAQAGKLAALLGLPAAVAQPLRRMVADLLETHQEREDRAPPRHPVHLPQLLGQRVHAGLIQRRLQPGKPAERLQFGLVRQVADHRFVRLAPPQQVRLHQLAQRRVAIRGCLHALAELAKRRRASQQSRVQKIHQRPQIAQPVFHRRSGHGDARVRPQLLHRPRLPGPGVLDRLRFVQHAQPPAVVAQPLVARCGTVRGQHEVRGHFRLPRSLRRRRAVRQPHRQLGREPRDFCLPVAEQRCRHHHQRRPAITLPLQRAQKREHLQGLAQTHVVGQTRAEAQAHEQVQPADALGLVRPQLRRKMRPRIGRRQMSLRGAQFGQRVRQPRPRGHGAPRLQVPLGRLGAGLRTRQHAHRLVKTQPAMFRPCLHRLVVGQHRLQALAVHLDPLSAQQLQTVHARQQPVYLGGSQRLAIQGHANLKIQQRARTQRFAPRTADGRRHLRPRRSTPVPGLRHPHDEARRFQCRHFAQEFECVVRRPAHRRIELACRDFFGQPRTLRRGQLHGRQQRQQPLRVTRRRSVTHCAPQRQVLGTGRRRQTGRVRRQKRERQVRILFVFREVQVHAADGVPGRMLRREPGRHVAVDQLRQRVVKLGPQPRQQRNVQVFATRQRRRAQDQTWKITMGHWDLQRQVVF